MDFIDFLENIGLGMTIIVAIVVILILLIFVGRLIPVLLMSIGSLFLGLVVLVLLGAVIYFIGIFAKDFFGK